MTTRKYIAHAPAALQPDVPDPAVFLRGRYRMRNDIAVLGVVWHLYGQGAIDEQHVAAIDEGDTHRFAQQQRPDPGAVDEEVAIELSRLARLQIGDITRLASNHPGHVVYDMIDAGRVCAI